MSELCMWERKRYSVRMIELHSFHAWFTCVSHLNWIDVKLLLKMRCVRWTRYAFPRCIQLVNVSVWSFPCCVFTIAKFYRRMLNQRAEERRKNQVHFKQNLPKCFHFFDSLGAISTNDRKLLSNEYEQLRIKCSLRTYEF